MSRASGCLNTDSGQGTGSVNYRGIKSKVHRTEKSREQGSDTHDKVCVYRSAAALSFGLCLSLSTINSHSIGTCFPQFPSGRALSSEQIKLEKLADWRAVVADPKRPGRTQHVRFHNSKRIQARRCLTVHKFCFPTCGHSSARHNHQATDQRPPLPPGKFSTATPASPRPRYSSCSPR